MFSSPEDLGQEYIVRLLEGKHKHATVQQAVIDIARDITGRKGSPNYEDRKAVALAIQTDPAMIQARHRPFDVVNRRLFLEQAMNTLTDFQRKVILMFLDGLTLSEIADMLGYTEAWISRIWHDAVELMRGVAK